MQITSWANKRILITGSGGFIGSHLLRYFQLKKAKVIGLSRRKKVSESEISVNTTDFDGLLGAIKEFKPDAFFHLASEALVESGQVDPYHTFHNNIVSALNVLEATRLAKTSRVIIASTVHVYGNSPLPYREDDPARPSRPYETSKTCIDLVAQSYADTYGTPVLIPRFVNVYGPGDTNLSRIVPKTINSLLQGDQPVMWGGGATRDYLYIDDAIRAYDLLGKISDIQIEKNRIFNFATGNPVTAKEMMSQIITLTGKKITIKKIRNIRENELDKQEVSWEKAKKVLGWTPRVKLSDGLKRTLEWYTTESLH